MKIVLVQMSVDNDYKKNLEKIIDIINQNKFDIIVFPELALTGYNLKKVMKISDKWLQESFLTIQNIINSKQKVIVGTLKREGKSIYNSVAVIGKMDILFYHKNTLTEYDFSYFDEGKHLLTFDFKKQKIGILICRDQDNYKLIKRYRKSKCTILLQLSAHYYKPNIALKKLDKNIAMPIVRAIDSETLYCKVNVVGRKKNEISLGGSMIVNSQGCIQRKANMFTEEIIKFNTKEEKCK